MSDNPPAFPTQIDGVNVHGAPGLTMRDWFAGQALTGLVVGCAGMLGREFSAYAEGHCNAVLVERSYALADAMLAARPTQGGQP